MKSIVDKLNELRGTRLTQDISATIFLGLGLYNLSFESGGFAFVIGVLFSIYGLLGVYRLLVRENHTVRFVLNLPPIGLGHYGICEII